MARSIGEAASTGLVEGFVLGRNTQQMARENARRDMLDQQNAEDRQMQRATAAEQRARQMNLDRIAALDAQIKGAGTAQQGVIDSGVQQTPEQQAAFTQRVGGATRARDELLSKISGFDLAGAQARGKSALARLQQAGDPSGLEPGELTAAVSVATGGRNPSDFVRQNGQPSVIEQAGQDFYRGIEAGDEEAVLRGANVIYAPSLKAGVGKPSPHGGVIVGKEFVGLTPAPGGDPNDPRFVPTVRVYVRDEAKAGDFARLDRANDKRPPGAQQAGATSYYDAPLTEDRSSDSKAKVKTIGLRDGMETLAHNLNIAELLNRPDALTKLQEDQQAGAFDPELYAAALGAAGVKPKSNTKKVSVTTVPAGGSALTTIEDAKGGVTQTVTQGNEKPTKPTPAQEALDLFEKYPERFKSLADARAFVTPSKAANQAAGVGGGGKGGGKAGADGDAAGISTAEKRALDVQRDALKRRTDALDKKRQRIHDDYKDDLPEPLSTADQFNEDAKASRAVKVEAAKKRKADALKALDKEAAEIADREAALDARMTNTEGSTAANPKPKPTGGAGRTLADTPSKAPAGAKDFSSLWK